VKLFLNSELSRLRKNKKKMNFWLMWMKDNNSQNALGSMPKEATPTGNIPFIYCNMDSITDL